MSFYAWYKLSRMAYRKGIVEMRITAFDTNTNEGISVMPIAIKPSDSWDSLLIVDAKTQQGIWRDSNLRWRINLADDDPTRAAEEITGIYGATVEEWEDVANVKLAEFGFRLGALDRRAEPARWELVDAYSSKDD